MPTKRSHFWLYAHIVLIAALMLCLREVSLLPDGKVHAYFLDVGQGDSALLVSPSGKQIVVDGGPDTSLLEHLGRLMPFFDRSIDLLVLSHPNLDHIAAFPELLRRYRVQRVLFTGVKYPFGQYEDMLAEIAAQKIGVILADPALDIDMGDGLVLDLLWPRAGLLGKEVDYKETNNTSIALRAIHGSQSILFTGDMEEVEERQILASGADIRSTVLKVAHHGSRTSSSTGFILAVRPDLAVISVGAENSYGHPSKEILDRFAHFGIPVRTTAWEGTIALTME